MPDLFTKECQHWAHCFQVYTASKCSTAKRFTRASFEALCPFEKEISDDETIDPTSNGEVIALTKDDEGQVRALLYPQAI